MNVITDNNTIIGLPPLRDPATGHVTPAGRRDFAVMSPASECTRDDLLEIAVDAAQHGSWELTGSSEHVEAICRDYSRIALDLEDARALAVRQADLHMAAEAEVARLRGLLAQQSTERARDAHLWLAMERLCLRVTGEPSAVVLARLTAEDASERTRMAVELAERQATQRIERAGTAARKYSRTGYVDMPDTTVVEVEG